jgi:hypothetical protein
MQGFSSRNLKTMRAFAKPSPNPEMVPGGLAPITRYHHIALLKNYLAEKSTLSTKVKRRDRTLTAIPSPH